MLVGIFLEDDDRLHVLTMYIIWMILHTHAHTGACMFADILFNYIRIEY